MATTTATPSPTPTPTVSAWGKPGAWALDAEEHEAELKESFNSNNNGDRYVVDFNQNQKQQPLADFPSLSAAATTKSKKKKPQTLSLSEFNTGAKVTHGSAQPYKPKGLSVDELLVLPTGPRERTAEEIERSKSRGFNSYGMSGGGGRDDSSSSRWGSEPRRNGGGFGRDGDRDREREPRELGPSRADEVDDWGAAKKSSVGAMSYERSERRERGGGGGFFDSQSKADESDNWASAKKSFAPSDAPPRRFGGSGSGGFERERRSGFGFEGGLSNVNGGADAESWGKRREDHVNLSENGGRPKLVLQPRSMSNGEEKTGLGSAVKTKGSNPFGEARPREEVLAEKGQDVKDIDEQLESVKVKEVLVELVVSKIPSSGKNPFGDARPREEVLANKGHDSKKIDEQLESVISKEAVVAPAVSNGTPFGMKSFAAIASEDRTERSWRKTVSFDEPISRYAC
ncbi:hypothetical protein GIB67_033857 [Kingdonia uniflora]|uniref:Uncharacterized protein n=1 Tax=Kingdonia uniflora TaxID=39325 RepID=A0A7J7MJC8_9MAGN|nr:hypothetical protein GIB67_033857 [Kingdonia uniflora]